jgi:phosphonate transport system ATP-binding protein
VAYVPQTLGLVRNMTALENALMGALGYTGTLSSLLKLFPHDTLDEAKATLTTLGLGDKMNKKVYALSGGERQRVAIARALMQRPSVILADEFVSQLDPITAEEILGIMREVARRGVGLLITTHETDVVSNYADLLVVMQDGRVTYEGPARGVSIPAMIGLLR